MDPASESPPPVPDPFAPDHRVYLVDPRGWRAKVQQSWDRLYCFGKRPGEDFHHLVMYGEVYLENDFQEVWCLECAIRSRALTRDRLHWQHEARSSEHGEL